MRSIGALALVVGACTETPDVPCDQSLLYREGGYTLAAPAGTTTAPTVIFGDPDGARPGECHYARNQGDEFCTEPGGWVDMNPGAMDGKITVTPHQHACAGFVVDSTYLLGYSFTMVPGRLWIEVWSANQ